MANQNFIVSFLFVVSCGISHVNGCFTSIFNFGDSLSDTGNSLAISHLESRQLPAIAFPPYGRTFFHRPTGRCCDGRLILDFLAEALGLPYVPPYFGGLNGTDNFQKGVNFAVVGGTALDFAFLEERGIYNDVTNISLGIEIGLFRDDVLPSLCSSSSDCKELLGSSLIVMGEIGGNDYLNGFLGGKKPEYVRQFVPLVVHAIGSAIKELIELGAVTLLVPGIQPIGGMPALLTYFQGSDEDDYDPKTGCLIWANQFVKYHNELLRNELQRIRDLHPNVNIFYADRYNALKRIYDSPKQFGITETLRACCGKGGPYNYNSSRPCGEAGVRTCCSDPPSFISWDGLHLTEAIYRLIFDFIFEGLQSMPSFNKLLCSPSTGSHKSE